MSDSPSSSFIPKRGVAKKTSSFRKSNLVLLPVISYALFVSAPLASAAIFIYERHIENQFNKAVISLDEAVVSFNESDFTRVSDFDQRLSLSKSVLNSHVSFVSLFKEIETATAQTAAFKNIDITRNGDTLLVEGMMSTPALDGAIFQRSSYLSRGVIQNTLFGGVTLVQDAKSSTGTFVGSSVEFKVSLVFPIENILYKPVSPIVVDVPNKEVILQEVPNEEIPDTANSSTDPIVN